MYVRLHPYNKIHTEADENDFTFTWILILNQHCQNSELYICLISSQIESAIEVR